MHRRSREGLGNAELLGVLRLGLVGDGESRNIALRFGRPEDPIAGPNSRRRLRWIRAISMKIELISPKVEDAWFWHQVRGQETTQRFNAMGVLDVDRLRAQIAESNLDISARQRAHRYFIKINGIQFAGVIAIREIDWESGVCDLGYLIAEKYQNQGIATRAVALILQKAFYEGKLRKVKAITAVSNVASYRVLEKNGFSLEGSLKEELLIARRAQDAYLWGLTSDNFKSGI